jgi:hypothetical protein
LRSSLITFFRPKGKPIRLLTVTPQNLLPAEEAVEQISLFDAPGGS